MELLVISTFEGGYQPVTAMAACTAVNKAGFHAELLDVYVDGVDVERIKLAKHIAISIPLFDSLESGVALLDSIKEVNPEAKIIFFGQYATLNPERLTGKYGDYTIVGEFENPLVSLIDHLILSKPLELSGICTKDMVELGSIPRTYITRGHISVPDRSIAPPLKKYPQEQISKLLGREACVGGIETSRGCVHKCTYCSVFAAYETKVVRVSTDTILKDVEQLVNQGMTHLTFTDADFFNVKRHNLNLVQTLHETYPDLTFDLTTRIDFILELEQHFEMLAKCNVKFITSALEFPTQRVLDIVAKDITVEDIEDAIRICNRVGIKMNPTFIMYNPWVTPQDLDEFHDFVARNELGNIIDPVQYETRLKLYKGSPLLNRNSTKHLELEEKEFHYDWVHPIQEVDVLYQQNVTPVEEGVFKRCCLKC